MLTTLLLAAVLAVGQAEAAPPDGAALAAKVKSLVRQLDHEQAAQREAAEKELVALGPGVLELLPTVTSQTPAELKNRLGRVRTALVNAAIEATTRASLVTLSGELKLSAALASIEKQTGNKFVDYRERFNQEQRDPSLKLDLAKVPFWQAVDTVLDAAEVTLYSFDEEADALAYVARGEQAPRLGRSAYAGLFRLEPVRIEATRDLRVPANRSLRLVFDVLWEPRVQPIVLQQPLADVKAVDENGAPLAADEREGEVEVPVEFNNAGVELEIPLALPDRSVKQVASIHGKLLATVPGRLESFEFDGLDKARNVEKERGGVTVTVEQARRNGDIFEVLMRVRFDKAANALESHRGWIYNNPAYLLDPKGRKIEDAGLEATLLALNEVGLSYKFDLEDAKLADLKFVYQTPAAILKLPVEFELKHIDLP